MDFSNAVNSRLIRLLLPALSLCALAPSRAAGLGEGAAVKTDNPRDTMVTFMDAMNDYANGVRQKDHVLEERILDAVRCLNLENESALTREQAGRDSAILIKEIIDRSILIAPEKIPDDQNIQRWRLKGTEIAIAKVNDGERAGEFLFSQETVRRAEDLYQQVHDKPYIAGSGKGAGYREPWLRKVVPSWARHGLFGIAYWQWAGLFIVILLGLTMRAVVRGLCLLILRVAKHTRVAWDDKLIGTMTGPLALVASCGLWYSTLHLLSFKGPPLFVMTLIIRGLFFGAVIWLFYRGASVFAAFIRRLSARSATPLDDHLVVLIARTLKIFVVVFGVLVAAQNLGVEVFSLLAGLGLGGLAVALAAKDSLANLFASVHLMIDRPFRIGHWIRVGNEEGTVEDIGFRSTRLRTFSNSVLSIPNAVLANESIDNIGLRRRRRIKTTIGVSYATPADTLRAFVQAIRQLLVEHPRVPADDVHVALNGFGSSSLDILVCFHIDVQTWGDELTDREAIFFDIIRTAERLGVDFAFPTQTIHVASMPTG
jgi:MscS family membrane protein